MSKRAPSANIDCDECANKEICIIYGLFKTAAKQYREQTKGILKTFECEVTMKVKTCPSFVPKQPE